MFGAALWSSGLGRRTALGATALVAGANLPDVDILSYLAGPAADLEWRRGWSHGILALVILPFVLTGLLLLVPRRGTRARSGAISQEVSPKQLLLLSYIAILSHPVLDTLNTYGVRWLMPFSGRWFYGDALFIVDPWVWLALGVGVYLSRRRGGPAGVQTGPARLALAAVLLYIGMMSLSGIAARRIVAREVKRFSGKPVGDTMVGPVPLDILMRSFVVEQDREYLVGTFRWLGGPPVNPAEVVSFPRGRPSHPAVAVAESTQIGRRFLIWARFPTFEIEQTGDSEYVVHMVDLRYARRPGQNFGTVSIPVRLPSAFVPSPDSLAPSSSTAPASRDPSACRVRPMPVAPEPGRTCRDAG